MADDRHLVRPATAAELADVGGMHAANRAAWDEAAERYEGWFDEAVALIRSGGTNLFGVEAELIGDLHGRCRRAIHLQCAGGRDTLSLWNHGADEVIGIDFSPRMLELAARLSAATGAPARWILADVLDAPAELDGTADLVYTGRGSLIWLGDLDAWAAVIARLLSPTGRFVLFEGHPVEWLFDADADGHWVATDYDYFGGAEASSWLGPRVHRAPLDRRTGPELEVRPGMDARRDRHRAARCGPAPRGRRRVPDRLVGRPWRRAARGTRPDPALVLGRRASRARLTARSARDEALEPAVRCPRRRRSTSMIAARRMAP